MKKFKIIASVLIFSFLLINLPQPVRVSAGTDLYPIEVVTPDRPLIEFEEATFYIIVNDQNLREEIKYFTFQLYGTEKEIQTIPYNGESYISFKRKIPSLTYAGRATTKTEAFTADSDKPIISITKSIDYHVKYPSGYLPPELNDQVQKNIAEGKGYKSFSASYQAGDAASPRYDVPFWGTYINTLFDKKYTDDEVVEEIKSNINSATRNQSDTVYQGTTATVSSEEIAPADKNIDKIAIDQICNAKVFSNEIAFYDCESFVYVYTAMDEKMKIEDEDKIRLYTFDLKKYGREISPSAYQGEIEAFQSMVRDFAKSIVLADYPKDFEEMEQSSYLYQGYFSYQDIQDNTSKSFTHSETYDQVLAGNTPGVEELVKVKKDAEDRIFDLSFKFNNNATIWNSGVANTGTDKDTDFQISVNIAGRAFDKDHREIKDISSEELYKDVYLVYEIVNPKSQIYFQEDPSFGNKLKVKVDDYFDSQQLRSKGPITYKGPYFPTEYVKVYLVNKEDEMIAGHMLYVVNVKDASPKLEMEQGFMKIDDKADGVFKFRINDDYHDKLECVIKVPYEKYAANNVPVPVVSRESSGKGTEYIEKFECKPNEWISIRVTPPKLSNFDMLAEMNGLSMWDLQRSTMETFATDLVGVGVDARLDNLGEKKKVLSGIYEKGYVKAKNTFDKIDKYEQTIRTLNQANGLATDAQNAIKLAQIKTNIDSHISDVKDATSGGGEKDWVETGYDWGVAGINILQSTVGAVAMAPKHIPFVGKYAQKVTGKFTLVFNLMTNVWKGNLQYLSKEKKMDRAQEKNIPYPIIITAVSADGFEDVDAQVVSVIYNYLEN